MEKELNQTTASTEAEVKVQEQEQKTNYAEVRAKIEERYTQKLAKMEATYTAQIEAYNKELDFYKTKLPQLEQSFIKNGGNKDYFNDWLNLNKDKINYEDLDTSIKTTFEAHKWAKQGDNFNVFKQLNTAVNVSNQYKDEDYEEGTPYLKPK